MPFLPVAGWVVAGFWQAILGVLESADHGAPFWLQGLVVCVSCVLCLVFDVLFVLGVFLSVVTNFAVC